MPEWSDDEICAGMRDPAARPDAFRALHRRYGPRLLGLLVRMCHGDRERAEDLLGRALYRAYGGLLRQEEPLRSLQAWLYTVAARTALDELAAADAEDPLRAPLPLHEELASAPPEALERHARHAEIELALEAVLARLEEDDPRYRTLLEMEHVGACERGEIAEATGIPRKQIAQYLKRARTRFVQLAREHPALRALEESPENRP
jgi:RNA polymerase sigma-70 factor (ECF subfamily)